MQTENIFEDVQKIADKIKSDVEKQLNQSFERFRVVENEMLKDETNPNKTSYLMKVNTDNNESKYLSLRATPKDSGSGFTSTIEELFSARSPFEDLLTKFDTSKTGVNSIQQLANRIQKDVEKDLKRSFSMFDVLDYHPILTDPKHTSYYIRIKIDDNGYLRVKTIRKEPGKDFETHIEEYHKGKPITQGGKKLGRTEGTTGRMEGTSGRLEGTSGRREGITGRTMEGTSGERRTGMDVEQGQLPTK